MNTCLLQKYHSLQHIIQLEANKFFFFFFFFLLNSKCNFFMNYYIYSEYREAYFRNTSNIIYNIYIDNTEK